MSIPWSLRAVRRASIATLVALAAGAPALAATHTVSIAGMVFEPVTVHAAAGDRIVWFNRDVVPHTASALDQSFESGRIDPEEQWTLVVTTTGTVDYQCAYHPTMQGRLEVQ